MSFTYSAPDDKVIRELFVDLPKAPEQTYEIALVLGGTVSAGAYTAGAIDFLIEALDNWTALRDQADPEMPQHKVLLRIITGTSGGGVIAAIAARMLNFKFPPVAFTSPAMSEPSPNPLYDIWVKTLTFDRFLETSDIGTDVVSLLNGKPVDEAAGKIVQFEGQGLKQRSWVAAPLRVILTLTNLRGIPYKLDFGSGRTETYIDHADHIRYAIAYDGQPINPFRPDELVLDFTSQNKAKWDDFSKFARATGAFPIGFPPRALVRPMDAGGQAPPSGKPYDLLVPDWDSLADADGSIPNDYEFLAVDGGATDNEPIELGRTGLCGIIETNPREAAKANRGVILIDPFAGEADLGPKGIGKFVATLGGVGNALIEQTRYDSRDLVLAADDKVFSRFMLTPERNCTTGADAIASSGLSAFIGFACKDFTRYDYLLGRQNCQEFLRKRFYLSEKNAAVFGEAGWTPAQKNRFAGSVPDGMLPIIPLVGTADVKQQLPAWPKGKLDPEAYRAAIERRFRAIARTELSGTPLGMLIALVGGLGLEGKVSGFIMEKMKQNLNDANL
jgi:Patatin-like phospholipase